MANKIYEAALFPESWGDVLESMTDIAGGVGTVLLAADTSDLRYISTPGLKGFVEDFASEGWADPERNTRTPAVLAANHAGFILEEDVYTPEEIAADPLINGFLRPRGLGWATATAFPLETGETLVFSVERAYAAGPVPRQAVEQLDRIRPHLGRAALISARLKMERARAAVETLALLGLPAGIVSRSLELRAANALLDELIPDVVRDVRGRVGFASPRADAVLERAFARRSHKDGVSIPLPATEATPAIVSHLVPVRGLAQDLFVGSAYLLVLTPVRQPSVPGAGLLQGLFDLTAAEARVVRGIIAGETTTGIADKHGVDRETIRTQLRNVFAKTGVKRQIDLVRVVSGLSLRSDEPV